MSTTIGFKDLQPDWEGPIGLKFTLESKHSQTFRYNCKLEKQKFSWYAPHFLFKNHENLPEHIVVILGKSKEKMPIGFHSDATTPLVTDKICEYDFFEETGHSYLYTVLTDRQKYSLYVPKEIIQDSNNPGRLCILLAEFDDTEADEDIDADAIIYCPHCNKAINLDASKG